MPSHPLIKHWLAVARNRLSPPPVFRSALAELGRLLIYEAIEQEEWLPTLEGQAETPCGVADVSFVDVSRPVKVTNEVHLAKRAWLAYDDASDDDGAKADDDCCAWNKGVLSRESVLHENPERSALQF